MKKRIGIVSYNIYCNFTNYGSALQSWALCQSIKKIAGNIVEPVLVDYCPEILADKEPLNPFANMWDKDEESRKMCELTLPAIQENYYKFDKYTKIGPRAFLAVLPEKQTLTDEFKKRFIIMDKRDDLYLLITSYRN